MSVQLQIREILQEAAPHAPRPQLRDSRYIAPGSDLYRAIVDDLRAGTSYYRAARNAGVAPNTVRRIARLEGLERHDPKVLAAAQARATYSHQQRVALLDQACARLEALLEDVATPKDLAYLVDALGLLILRRRVEDDVTDWTIINRTGARESLAAKLEALAWGVNDHEG
jgi:hypothetical protein